MNLVSYRQNSILKNSVSKMTLIPSFFQRTFCHSNCMDQYIYLSSLKIIKNSNQQAGMVSLKASRKYFFVFKTVVI